MNGAILAGGAAARLGGAPKGLFEVGGQRILDRLVAVMQAAFGVPPLLVANASEAAGWHPGLRVVADRTPGLGTLGGIQTAVAEAPAPVVCVAWDMPFVPPELLRQLAAGLEGFDICLPASGGPRGMEPLCAAYGPACAPAIADAVARSDLRAVAFHRSVRVNLLPEARVRQLGDPARLFFNINTPEDLVRANGMTP